MSYVVGFSGNIARPSKTRIFVEQVAKDVAATIGAAHRTYDIEDLGSSVLTARRTGDLDGVAQTVVEDLRNATVLVVGSPTYKGSYTGLFKHFFDLLDPSLLRGKPTILLATGGGERHSLIVEHQLRPLFGFFEALTMPTAIYASDKDFVDGVLSSSSILDRARQAVNEAVRAVGVEPRGVSLAA